MSLIEVSSVGESSTVRAYSDAVLIWKDDGYGEKDKIVAMSMAGPEQAVRALAAGCSLQPAYTRSKLLISDPLVQARYVCVFHGGWSARGHMITPSTMHLLAFSVPTVDKNGEPEYAVIIPETGSPDDVETAVYRHVVTNHSTPLLPLESPGQPVWEKAAAKHWCSVIGAAIIRNDNWWTPLTCVNAGGEFRAGMGARWRGSGVLTMTTDSLDDLVRDLIQKGRIRIPREPIAPTAPAQEAAHAG